MTELSATPDGAVPLPVTADTPVLITEQQVLMATAAATGLPNTAAVRVAWHRLVALLHRPRSPQPRRRYAPAHPDYLEYAAMAREMYRL